MLVAQSFVTLWTCWRVEGKDVVLTPWDPLAFIGGCDNSVKQATLWGTRWRAAQWEELLHGPENESARVYIIYLEIQYNETN